MSANNDQRGFSYLIDKLLDPFQEAMFNMMFDEDTDIDEQEIKADLKDIKIFKQMCLVKTLLWPIECVLTYFVMGKKLTKDKAAAQKIYWKLLRNKITIAEFKQQILNSIQGTL